MISLSVSFPLKSIHLLSYPIREIRNCSLHWHYHLRYGTEKRPWKRWDFIRWIYPSWTYLSYSGRHGSQGSSQSPSLEISETHLDKTLEQCGLISWLTLLLVGQETT